MRDRDRGGVLLTQAIHTLDLMLHLAGPATTVAFSGYPERIEIAGTGGTAVRAGFSSAAD